MLIAGPTSCPCESDCILRDLHRSLDWGMNVTSTKRVLRAFGKLTEDSAKVHACLPALLHSRCLEAQ